MMGRLASLRLRNRYLTDPTVSNWKIAHFLSYLLRSNLNLKENHPFSIRSVEIRPELEESGEISSRFGLISSRYAEISSRFVQILSRSAWSFWDPPRSHQDPVRSRQIRRLLAKSGKFSHNSKLTEDRSEPGENSTTRTNSIHRSVAGLRMENPKWSGRFWVGHKLDLDWPVDNPTLYIDSMLKDKGKWDVQYPLALLASLLLSFSF